MKRIAIACGLAACLPLAALATERANIDEDFNGLNIETNVVGSISEGDSDGSMTAGIQLLEVTNNADVAVTCQLEPGPSEGPESDTADATIEPGESTQMQMGSDYASVTTRARISCREAS